MTRHEVPAGAQPQELSHYLRRAWPLLPGHVLRKLLKDRDVRINGARAGKGDRVRGGDLLEIYAPDRYFAPEAELLFDDGRLLAAVKPQGLPSLPDRDGVGADTMEARLQRVHPGARLCHRLDAGTGGVMLAALDGETEALLFEAFKAHALKKTYRAVLLGCPAGDARVFRAHLIKDARRACVRVLAHPAPGSKEIVTRFKPLRALENGCWEAELEPVTGRTHQLRAHMAFLNCPILGDDKYGDREANRRLAPGGRLCLWCETMEIPPGAIERYAGLRLHADPPEWQKQ